MYRIVFLLYFGVFKGRTERNSVKYKISRRKMPEKRHFSSGFVSRQSRDMEVSVKNTSKAAKNTA